MKRVILSQGYVKIKSLCNAQALKISINKKLLMREFACSNYTTCIVYKTHKVNA